MGYFDRLAGFFDRPNTAATRQTVVALDTMGATGETAGRGFAAYADEGYAGNGPIFSLVAFKATALSETKIHWRDATTKEPTDRPLPTQLTSPWPQGSLADLFSVMSTDASLAGTAFIRRSGDRLFRLRPDWVDIVIPVATDGTWTLDGFLYWHEGRGTDAFTVLTADEVRMFAPNPDPMAVLRGQSWLRPVAREGDADTLMSKHKIRFFTNAATPNMAIVVQQDLSPEQRKLLTTQFSSKHAGWDNAYKTVLLEGGADLKVVGSDFEQMSFTNVQAAGETRLASAANVPPIAVGFVQGIQSATYSNYQQAMRRFNDLSWRPDATKAVAALSGLVDPVPGLELALDLRAVPFLQQDAQDEATIAQSQAQAIRTYVDAGYVSDTAVEAVVTGDPTKLQHTGLFSVQLQPPMTDGPEPDQTQETDDDE